MRLKYPLSLYFPLLIFLTLSLAADSQEQPYAEQNPISDADLEPPDVCIPLYEAQAILKELQPSPNAHLERKASGSVGPFGSKWGEGLGWGHEGPLSTALRLLPRLLNTLLSPISLLQHLPIPLPSYLTTSPTPRSKRIRISKTRRAKIDAMLDLMDEAEAGGCDKVYGLRAGLKLFPPRGMKQDLRGAYDAYDRYLKTTSDAEAQFMIGLFHSTGLGGIHEDHGKATLYYTFSALQGYRPAEMALGYKHWAGISVKEDCMTALDYYEGAAEKAYAHFLSGPPGGRTLPLTTARLSDLVGGIYGPHASWASTGTNAFRAAVRAAGASARGETEAEVLEYYQYHSDRDSHVYTVRLGRLFYLGSVYPLPGGVSSGAEGVGEIPQSYTKAKEYFMKVARNFWPKDFDSNGHVVARRKMSKEVEDGLREATMVAAAFLGRMALRGEGQKRDYRRARLWYERAAELGDREAHNGLGIIHRDGLLVPVDKAKAYHYFQAAAQQDLAEAQVNLGKLHLERGEIQQAVQYFEVALRHGSPFEAFHLLAHIHATQARLPPAAGGQKGSCGVSVAWFKLVSERGPWTDDFMEQGDKAWMRGEEDVAFVKWLVAAEMGYEMGQNNIAFLLDQGRGGEAFGIQAWDKDGDVQSKGRGMRWWVRSAAQDNVDAMVKVGDLYYSGYVPANLSAKDATSLEMAATYYQTAADTQVSSMAYWNLGWMYEMGMGVPRDWFLAKRFYDLSGEVGGEGWIAVGLSVLGLYLRSWWTEIRSGGEIPGLRLFEKSPQGTVPTFWERVSSIFTLPPGEPYDFPEDEGYDDLSGSQWGGGTGNGGAGAEEDFDEDLIESVVIISLVFGIMGLVWLRGYWARAEAERLRREREREQGREGDGGAAVEQPAAAGVREGQQEWRLEPPFMM